MIELRNDINELKRLMGITTRLSISQMLNAKITELEDQLAKLPQSTSSTAPVVAKDSAKPATKVYKNLTSFAWDQDHSFVKIFVTLNNIHTLEKESIKVSYEDQSMKVLIEDLEEKNYELKFSKFLEQIVPSECSFKLMTNRLSITLKKKKAGHWECLSFHQKKPVQKPPPVNSGDDSKDPMGGLMKMMKQMYDEGDDEMKRTIAKAWHEARDKNIQPQF